MLHWFDAQTPFRRMIARSARFTALLGLAGGGIMSVVLATPASGALAATGNNCAVCLYDGSDAGSLSVDGNSSLTINGGSVTVDSSAAGAAVVGGNATVSSAGINVVGAARADGNGSFSPTPLTGVSAAADPLGGLAVPSSSGSSQDVALGGNDSRTIGPGLYGSIDVGGNASLTLDAGVYVVTRGLTVSGNASLTANNVALYFACSGYPTGCNGGQAGAGLQIDGNSQYQITSPTTDAYQGVAIFYERNNAAPLRLSGNGTVTGTIYAKSAGLLVDGNGEATLNSLVLVNTARLASNGNVTVDYNGSQNSPQVSWPS